MLNVPTSLTLNGASPSTERDGADALSMRRLARALDRDPMILYRHAPNKAALLDGVAETVLAQLRVDSADPDWAGQLREVAGRFRALSLAEVGPAAMLSRALGGVAGQKAIFALLGSPAAAELGLRRLILPVAPHLLGQLRRAR